jgi:hypothetical protein
MPVTMPVDEPTFATDGLLLTQVPPVMVSESVIVVPMHTVEGPAIIDGSALTVTFFVITEVQPHASVIESVTGCVPDVV